MNAKTCLLCVAVFLSACLYAQAQGTVGLTPPPQKTTETIPGGIAAIKDGCIRFYDFAKKTTTKLGEADVFAIMDNGEKMIKASGADGHRAHMITSSSNEILQQSIEVKGRLQNVPFVLPNVVENLTIAPSGKFSFEGIEKGKSLVRFVPNNPLERGKIYANVPWYIRQDDACHKVQSLTINENLIANVITDCGNTAIYPPELPYKIWGEDITPHYDAKMAFLESESYPWPVMPETKKRGTTLVPADLVKRYAVPRNAGFGAWSKDGELFAIAYQMPRCWYIEINDSTPQFETGRGYEKRLAGVKPGYYELFLPRKVYGSGICCLSWRAYSLTVLNKDGKLFSVSRSEIERVIAGSGLAPNPNRLVAESICVPIAVNNTALVSCELVADGIYGTRMVWTSDDAFLFRDEKGALMRWKQKTVEKLLDRVPEQFFYCNKSPVVRVDELVPDKGASRVVKAIRPTEDNWGKKTFKVPISESFNISEVGDGIKFLFYAQYIPAADLCLKIEVGQDQIRKICLGRNSCRDISNIKTPPACSPVYTEEKGWLKGTRYCLPNHDVRINPSDGKNTTIIKIDDMCIAIRAWLEGKQVVCEYKILSTAAKK